MGYDAFGLPAENHAIKTGEHPRESTAKSIAAFQESFRSWGISIDWSREFATSEPSYYRWTQWIFLQLFERGLAYRKEAAVNWCPKDATVLANEQVIDGRCERCGTLVEARQLEQWFFRITDYADRLLDDLETIEWPPHVKRMQRNWIGRSEGAEVTFQCPDLGVDYPVFTTRPDTLFGATFFVMAPEHPDVAAARRRHRARGGGPRLRQPRAEREQRGARRHRPDEDRRAARPHRDQPGQRRADPDVGRRLRAHGVRHRRRHGRARARPARLRVRREVRPADPPGGRARGRLAGRRGRVRRALRERGPGQLRPVRRHERRGRQGRDHRLARRAGPRSPLDQLSPARLAALPPALLGLPDPRPLLRQLRDRPRAGVRPACAAAGRRGLRAAGPVAARGRRRLGEHLVPVLRGRGAPRDRHDGHVRRLVLVLPALLRRAQRRGGLGPGRALALDAGVPVHRRHRARDPAPAVRAVLRQGADATWGCWTSRSRSSACSPRA